MSRITDLFEAFSKSVNLPQKLNEDLHHPARNQNLFTGIQFNKKLHSDEFSAEGSSMITLIPSTPVNRHIFFLHGGSYVQEGSIVHRRLIETFAMEYKLKVTYIDYPLAPEHTAEDTFRAVKAGYNEIIRRNPEDQICLFGDSAGGGLALAFRRILADQEHIPQPLCTAVSSPWLDITLGNPRIKFYAENEPLLTVEGLIDAGIWYAGKYDRRNPLVSPMFGSTDNLGDILLSYGTHEIFFPDCEEYFRKLQSSSGTHAEQIVGEKMFHDWVLAPIQEAVPAVKRFADFFLEDHPAR